MIVSSRLRIGIKRVCPARRVLSLDERLCLDVLYNNGAWGSESTLSTTSTTIGPCAGEVRMDQDVLIRKLREAVAAGNIVVVAGTGVSIMASGDQQVDGHPVSRWGGLLLHGVHHCLNVERVIDSANADALDALIKTGQTDFLISAAELIVSRLTSKSPGTYRGWLKDSVGKLKVRYPAILEAIDALADIVATLNYDGLLEAGTKRKEAVTWKDPDKVEEVLRGERSDAVLHLHGYHERPDTVVLGLRSYDKVVDDEHAKAVLNLLTMDRTILFVGCGATFEDPNFSRLIEWAKEARKNIEPRHFLLCFNGDLPKMTELLKWAPWIRPVACGKDYQELPDFLQGLALCRSAAPPLTAPSDRGPRLDLAAYRKAIRTWYGRLKVEALDSTTCDMKRLTLTGMFIPQNARECVEFLPRVFELPKEIQRRLREENDLSGPELDAEVIEESRRLYHDQLPRPVLEVLNDPDLNRLVVLGDPGSGKSSLLQYLALEWAEAADAGQAQPMPILIELREYARQHAEGQVHTFEDFLQHHSMLVSPFHRPSPNDPLSQPSHSSQSSHWLQSNPTIAMFDGLDEVFDPDLRREIARTIPELADHYPQSRVLVTSRVIGHQHTTWRDAGFRHFMLQELEPEQISDFLTRWHRDAYADLHDGEAKRQRLAKAIEDSRSIRELAGNPLLLTMMAILNRTQDLPRDRAELYEQCARLLLYQWKVEEALAKDPVLKNASLDYKDKRQLMLGVARTMREGPGGLAANLIEEDTLERTLSEDLKGIPGLRADRAARALIQQLRGRNFMICAVGSHAYAFVHRTFLEYFAAADLRMDFESRQTLTFESLRDNVFGQHWQDETWHETLCLLAGMIETRFVADIIQFLLAQKDLEQTCQHIFLAARCVGEVRKRDELGPAAEQALKSLKVLPHFNLDFYYEHWGPEEDRVQSVRTRAVALLALTWRDARHTRDWLRTLLKDRVHWAVRVAAVQELAQGWKEDPETLTILKARVQRDKDWNVRQAVVQELARGWKDSPDTLTWLKACTQQHEDWVVRQAAVQELAQGWKEDPDTLTILKACVQQDKDESVRETAVRELARGWKDDPDTLAMLKDRAQQDESSWVREAAVEELARGWKNDPNTLPWLKVHSQQDEIWQVRRAAIRELAQGWREDPDVLPILKAHAQQDENWGVRLAAVYGLASAWKDDPDTLPILKDRAQRDKELFVRRAAVSGLASAWKDDPYTLVILKERAQRDESGDMRWAAVKGLIRGWKEDPDTLPILKECAQQDKSSYVRQAAVKELARGWKEDPDTLPILKERAQQDKSSFVRQAAVKELARGRKEDPDTLPWLKDRAEQDKHSDLRRAAVRELARGWKEDPNTLPWLKDRAQHDEDSVLRQAAVYELGRRWRDNPEVQAFLRTLRSPKRRPRKRKRT